MEYLRAIPFQLWGWRLSWSRMAYCVSGPDGISGYTTWLAWRLTPPLFSLRTSILPHGRLGGV
jgi:hypothetical protein